ncbi:MAG: hypothetical protein M1484_04240 [Patescibacteria group bacterium]|nr:hypothetical protein [Patescibacteria group bacterium]
MKEIDYSNGEKTAEKKRGIKIDPKVVAASALILGALALTGCNAPDVASVAGNAGNLGVNTTLTLIKAAVETDLGNIALGGLASLIYLRGEKWKFDRSLVEKFLLGAGIVIVLKSADLINGSHQYFTSGLVGGVLGSLLQLEKSVEVLGHPDITSQEGLKNKALSFLGGGLAGLALDFAGKTTDGNVQNYILLTGLAFGGATGWWATKGSFRNAQVRQRIEQVSEELRQ